MKTLILGDGLLGSQLAKYTEWDVQSRKTTGLDITNLKDTIDLNDYDQIINCIADTNTYDNNPTNQINVNFKFVIALAELCHTENKRLVHISTDFVYSNSTERTEDSVLAPALNWYSYAKSMADLHLKNSYKNSLDWCIIRTSHKPKPFPYDKAWNDVLTSADYVDTISKLIIRVLEYNIRGIWNVGTSPKTIAQLAAKTNSNIKEVKSPDHVPKNTVMDLSKMYNLIGKEYE